MSTLTRPLFLLIVFLGTNLTMTERCLCEAAAPSPETAAARPNILLLVSDDQRPDTIGGLGIRQIETPNLDQLARRGTVFTNATCGYPICTPSRAEILTGCSSFRNGVFDFGGKIDPQLTTWAQTLRASGYHTCYVGKWHNNGRPSMHGYAESRGLFSGGGGRWWKPQVDFHGREVTGYRGWVFQTDDGEMAPEQGVGLTSNISERFADAAISLIEQRAADDPPFFLHVNFTAPHDPLLMPTGFAHRYDPAELALPANFLPEHPFDHGNFRGRDEQLLPWPRTAKDVRADLAVYYAVLTHLDAQVGRILEALEHADQTQRTLVLYTSDHGLAMGSHGLRGKQNMYDHTIRVPLVLAGPGVPAGRKLPSLLYLRDLYPTSCELAGIPIPASVEGRSLVPLLTGETDTIYPAVFGYFRDSQRMIRTQYWKLIHYPQLNRFQLFDLQADPNERRDLASLPRHAEIVADLSAQLSEWQTQVDDPLVKSTKTQK